MAKKTTRRSRQMTDYQSLTTRRFHSNRGQHLIKYIESIQGKIAAVEEETDVDLLEELEDLAETRDINLVSLKFNQEYRISRVQADESRDLESLRVNHEIKTKSLQSRFLNHLEIQNKKLSSEIRELTDISNDRASLGFLKGFSHVMVKQEDGEGGSRDGSTPHSGEESGEESGSTGRRSGRVRGAGLLARVSRETRETPNSHRDSDSDRFDMLGIVWTDSDKAALSGSERTGRRGRGEDSDHVDGHVGRGHKGKESAVAGLTQVKPAEAMADLQEMRRH
ncbi:hypothetical protein B0I72DRAFT_137766 [Yarrowia lipolytica]|jgi:hypothetical protein|uniref:YALI0C03047p n=2 Tax=Yarrowia lipolytica TaxID=4952 RepID=Q6CD78_YARLI|nr:YALI0C03047p [Yarrowia lipolytica CLIB122]AOW02267.1 hypothetical protein YALI1_C04117g [Yarrowia lipolytica]KAB8283529.1 hypothetical protein BKA91DRAFT_136491 [Yarrowia lipolytica]KAE8172081.1 hypothetical protein BKA90DRAFT_138005 [Yarrowia lipolytica]KAJ8053001.1 hypothetical protein LXG23DRAFT_37174 [Yarrowia lipolytica]QNP96399.1 Hypothetical protein YALI2_C00052g [Yarrowia lipolytica]|eukprot:XP_501384.1 YALI0C03047p [Yarrowia lipolytica CLIB122]